MFIASAFSPHPSPSAGELETCSCLITKTIAESYKKFNNQSWEFIALPVRAPMILKFKSSELNHNVRPDVCGKNVVVSNKDMCALYEMYRLLPVQVSLLCYGHEKGFCFQCDFMLAKVQNLLPGRKFNEKFCQFSTSESIRGSFYLKTN